MVVEEAIEQQMGDPAENPTHALLVGLKGVAVVVGAAKGLIIHDREDGETDVRQEKEIGEPLPDRGAFLLVAQIIEVNDQPKHEHRSEDRQDNVRRVFPGPSVPNPV